MAYRPQKAGVVEALCLLAAALPLAARDWPEPPRVTDPLLSIESPGIEASGFAMVEYDYQALRSSYDDLFQINALSALSVASLFPQRRLVQGAGVAVSYGSYLMNGKAQEGDSPGSRLQWMMNAVQFEYGIYLALRLLGLDLVADYSRTSQHPFRDQYSQVASDVLRAGVLARVPMPLAVQTLLAVRVGSVDLFDFWESKLPKPRTRLVLAPELWLERPLGSFAVGAARVRVAAACEGHLDWVFLREGGQGANASFRGGLRLELGALSCDVYLDGFASDNTEIREDRSTPAGLLGWGVQLATGALGPAPRGSQR